MSLTVQERAKPISVATRGVGIVCSVEYSRMITTWDLNAISEICTIYQFYRVTLMMVWYKLYLAQQVQYGPKSYYVGEDVAMPEEQRQMLATISQLPSATAGLLSAIGKVEADGKVYHSVVPTRPGDDAPVLDRYWYQTLVITPDNIGRLVEVLANPATPLAFRQLFIQHNSLPGARFAANGVLENPDDIWPPMSITPPPESDRSPPKEPESTGEPKPSESNSKVNKRPRRAQQSQSRCRSRPGSKKAKGEQ